MKKQLVDLAERVGWTFVQAFAAALTVHHGAQVAGVSTHYSDLDALKLGLVAGGYSALKFLGVQANTYLASPDPAANRIVFSKSDLSGQAGVDPPAAP